jgi:hypothetical protein
MAFTTKPLSADFYNELDQEFDGFTNHILVSQHAFDEDWGVWERHPLGDEIVLLQSGEADLVTLHAGEETTQHLSTQEGYVLIKKGTWQTARTTQSTSMLFITAGEGTVNQENPS